MTKKKTCVGLLCGGQSAEHEVSLHTVKSAFHAINKDRYDVHVVGINRCGLWSHIPEALLEQDVEKMRVFLEQVTSSQKEFILGPPGQEGDYFDIIFPLIHGTNGEDGRLQGLLDMVGIPYVGAGVLGSAVGMDKDIMKRLLRDADIPIAPFRVLRKGEKSSFEEIKKELHIPLFVKPANAGSSVGVSKVRNEKEYKQALKEAFQFDEKILLEKSIEGREVECAVLGNDTPRSSVCGEVVFEDDFYGYDTKYSSTSNTRLVIPANIDSSLSEKIQTLAIQTFQILECLGLGRVDFFVEKEGHIFVNEINTLPGFTDKSMYPKLWEATGLSYEKLIDTLLSLVQERKEKTTRLF